MPLTAISHGGFHQYNHYLRALVLPQRSMVCSSGIRRQVATASAQSSLPFQSGNKRSFGNCGETPLFSAFSGQDYGNTPPWFMALVLNKKRAEHCTNA
jgi:hypothetical protein